MPVVSNSLRSAITLSVIGLNVGFAACTLFGIKIPWLFERPTVLAVTAYLLLISTLLVLLYLSGVADTPLADMVKFAFFAFYFLLLLVMPKIFFDGRIDTRFRIYFIAVMITGLGTMGMSCRTFHLWSAPNLVSATAVPVLLVLARRFLYHGTVGDDPFIVAILLFVVLPFLLFWDWLGD